MNNDRNALKFFIGYFGLLPFLFFPVFELIFGHSSLSKLISDIKSLSFFDVILPEIAVFIFFYFLYRRWNNLKMFIWVIVSAILTDAVGFFIMMFTFPFWIFVSVVLMIYGLFTGLFKKETAQFQAVSVGLNNSDNIFVRWSTGWRRSFIFWVFIFCLFYFGFQLYYSFFLAGKIS